MGGKTKPTGRPSSYTIAAGERVCAAVAAGVSIRRHCRENPEAPDRMTVLRWLDSFPRFRSQYAHARSVHADEVFEEILDIADDASADTYEDSRGRTRTDHEVVARSRLRVDARRWALARMDPKRFGDKVQIGGMTDGEPLKLQWTIGEADLDEIGQALRETGVFSEAPEAPSNGHTNGAG